MKESKSRSGVLTAATAGRPPSAATSTSPPPPATTTPPQPTHLPVRHRVPLVQHDHARPSGLRDRLGQPKVLRRRHEPPVARARRGVDDERDDVGAAHRRKGPSHRQPFCRVGRGRGNGRAAPDPCGVDQPEQPRSDAVGGRARRASDHGVDGIARRPGHGADDGAGAPRDGVEQARLACVGPANDGDGQGSTGPAGVFGGGVGVVVVFVFLLLKLLVVGDRRIGLGAHLVHFFFFVFSKCFEGGKRRRNSE